MVGADGKAAAPGGAPYDGARIALVTRHGKGRVLGPVLSSVLGARLEVDDGFDTDALGTFTREVARPGTQLEAARRKAEVAIERSAASLGLGSEGAFVGGPFGFGGWNVELVVLVDRGRGIEVTGIAQGPGMHLHGEVRTVDELDALAARAGFPAHGLVLRPDGPDDPRIRKGITDPPGLRAAFEDALRASARGIVHVENDLRAHLNPTRMRMVEQAGRDLAERLLSRCPSCDAPGFGVVDVVTGLPCACCGSPTEDVVADERACVRCPARDRRPRPGAVAADPARCPFCNP
ncbi:MAG: hypothetical protein FGM39_06910 [Phycisphaerales bacterium]|nr:hypothetical protein [Phycisphaerales bacterium]